MLLAATTDTLASAPSPKVTRKELANHLRLSLRTIDALLSEGVLPFFKLGRCIRFDLAEVEAELRKRRHVEPSQRQARRLTSRRTSLGKGTL